MQRAMKFLQCNLKGKVMLRINWQGTVHHELIPENITGRCSPVYGKQFTWCTLNCGQPKNGCLYMKVLQQIIHYLCSSNSQRMVLWFFLSQYRTVQFLALSADEEIDKGLSLQWHKLRFPFKNCDGRGHKWWLSEMFLTSVWKLGEVCSCSRKIVLWR